MKYERTEAACLHPGQPSQSSSRTTRTHGVPDTRAAAGGKAGGKSGKGKEEPSFAAQSAEAKGESRGAKASCQRLSTLFMEGKKHTLCMRCQNGTCKDPSTSAFFIVALFPNPTAQLAVATTQHHNMCQHRTRKPASATAGQPTQAANASAENRFSFSNCLALLESTFAGAFAQAFSRDNAITSADACFNLGAFAFDGGKRRGLFQRTQQFSEAIQCLNAFLQFHFPAGKWSSICVSHNVRTMLHTDSGNEQNSLNHTWRRSVAEPGT